MIRKTFLIAAVAAFFLTGVAISHAAQAPAPPSPSAPSQGSTPGLSRAVQAHSATGKITAVSGDTFSIEVGQGDTKQTMQFMTDSSTAKSGQLKVGSTATVQYEADGTTNKATKVDVQG